MTTLEQAPATRKRGPGDAIVETASGKIRGRNVDGVTTFRGIPYAAPPFGANRLRPPQPVVAWTGVRDALDWGPKPPQLPYPPPWDVLIPERGPFGEDCLNLNIWTPEQGSAGLPVMVWIPGGMFEAGSGATYDGSRFARDGIVCVTINYRVGAEGFLYLGDGTANLGLLDQIAALEWVRENIAAFGGDPGNVTVFGQSAGAMSVGTLLSMPRAGGLFRRAIAQSGGAHQVIPAATARKVGRQLAEKLGVARDPGGDRGGPGRSPASGPGGAEGRPRGPSRPRALGARGGGQPDALAAGDRRRRRPRAADRSHRGGRRCGHRPHGRRDHRRVEVLPGPGRRDRSDHPRDPGRRDRQPMGSRSKRRWPPIARRIPAPGPASCSRPSRATGTSAFPSCAWPTRTRRARRATYMYEFAWRSPQFGGRLGACHGAEIAFVFDTLGQGSEALAGGDPPQQLARAMHAAWVGFARDGDPGWPRYDLARRATMRFDTTSEVVDDPRSKERVLWEGVR